VPLLRLSPTVLHAPRCQFSTNASESGIQLAEVLTGEILHETANAEVDEDYEDVKTLIEKTFKITDKEGLGEVILERKYKDELITVKFDCQDEVEDHDTDSGYDDIENELRQKSEVTVRSDEIPDVEDVPNTFGINFEVTVQKGETKVVFNCVASHCVTIENVRFVPAGTPDNAVNLYHGPRYLDLDEKVREGFQDYLTERKIDEDFSYYVVSAARYKEEREYVNWLQKITEFLEA